MDGWLEWSGELRVVRVIVVVLPVFWRFCVDIALCMSLYVPIKRGDGYACAATVDFHFFVSKFYFLPQHSQPLCIPCVS